jgi:hypothetical protein
VTLAQALQLYAPLAGLMMVVFWLGVLSNRVATLEREERDRKTRDAVSLAERDRITRMETTLSSVETQVERMARELGGVHRQLANISTGKTNVARELLGD